MKKSTLIRAILIQCVLTSSAIAAQDQALIQETRKNQLAHDAQASQAPAESTVTAKKVSLSLDHGPRAVVTPWVNQQRILRAEKEAKKAAAVNETGNNGDSNK